MQGTGNDQGFTSRYAIRKTLGNYPPWQGYGVTDSLSGKDYLLFSLASGDGCALSTDDLLMRDSLFADIAGPKRRALSIQENGAGIFFLLPERPLAALAKSLPSLSSEQCLRLAGSLAASFLDCIATGRFFGNLSIESVIVENESAAILPTAYLIPDDLLQPPGAAGPGGPRGNGGLAGDLGDFGAILSLFSRYLPARFCAGCSELAAAMRAADQDTTSDELQRIADELASLAGRDGPAPLLLAGRRPAPRHFSAALTAVREAGHAAAQGGRHLLLLHGSEGGGKTALLEQAAGILSGPCRLEGYGPLSDADTFGKARETDHNEPGGFVIHDDHHLDPILCGYIVERISQDLEGRRLALVCAGADPPQGFASALGAEARARGFQVADITLSAPDPQQSLQAVLDLFPAPARAGLKRHLGGDDTPAVMGLKARLAADPGRRRLVQGRGPLAALSREEKAVLQFIAVFRFEAPLFLLKDVFSAEEDRFYDTLHNLVRLGLVRRRTEISCITTDKLCSVYGIAGGSLARMIERSIPAARRRELHANIARILKRTQGAPPAYIFYHLVRCGEREEAAFQGASLLEHLLGRKRLGAIVCFHEAFVRARLDRHLPVEMRLKLMLDLGKFFSTIGEMDRAGEFFRLCRRESRAGDGTQGCRSLAVEALRRECGILENRGEFTNAQTLLKKTIATHAQHINVHERANLYNDLAWVDYRLGLFDESWENCLLIHRLLDKKQHPSEMAQSYNLMGAINWNRSKYDEALLCHRQCLSLREEGNDDLGVAASLNNIGLVYRSMGRVKEALESFTKSMLIKQRNNNLPGLAAVNLNLALTYLDLDDLEKAQSHCLTATRLAEDTGNLQLAAEASGTLGEICFTRGDHAQARDHYFRELHLCHKTCSLRQRAVALRRLAELSLAEGKADEATGLLSEARELNAKIRSRLETSLLDLVEGRLLLAGGKREQGRRRLEETAFELSLLGRKGTAASVSAELGELCLEEGNEPLAREYLLRSVSLLGESEQAPPKVLHLQEHIEQRSSLDPHKIHTDSARFRALCRVISLIRTIHDPDKMHMTITETARKITGMERAALIIQSNGLDTYRILAAVGDFESETILTDKNIIAILNITRQLGYPLDVSRTRVPEGRVGEDFLAAHPGIICTPLWIQDEVTGYLYLDSPRSIAGASDEDHTFLVAFSQQVALGLERMFLSDRVRRQQRPAPAARQRGRSSFQEIIGKSAAIRRIYELIDGIKEMETTVLLTGPNGGGKDLIARTIHYSGPRGDKPFHTLNCAALSRELIESELFGHEKGSFTGAYRQKIGHFESASEGTIFLNEIGELPLELQPKLLQVLEHRTFFRVGGTAEIRTGARIVCASNRDLLQLVREGRFREDLYYRINIFPIRVPSLSERREDIKLLCDHFLTTYCRLYNTPMKRISPEAMSRLDDYAWPGNVRELENTINRLVIISRRDTILPEDLPADIAGHGDGAEEKSLDTLENLVETILETVRFPSGEKILPRIKEAVINKVVQRTGDKTRAAHLLGISKPTLYSHLRNHEKNAKK